MSLSTTEANLAQATDSELNRAHEILYTLTAARYADAEEIMTQMQKTPLGEMRTQEYRYLKVRYEDARARALEEYARFRAVAGELDRRRVARCENHDDSLGCCDTCGQWADD